MEKPITLKRQEFIEELVKLVNASGLPAFAVAEALSNCLAEVRQLVNLQLDQDRKAWEEENNGTGEG